MMIKILLLISVASISAHSQNLTGYWHGCEFRAYEMKLPVLGTVEFTARSVSNYYIKQNGNQITATGELCDLKIKSSSRLINVELPPEFMRVIPKPFIKATISKQEPLQIHQPEQTIILGAKLAHAHDNLPTSKLDTRVFDHDHNGSEGVSINISGIVNGSIHIVQRNRTHFTLNAINNDILYGPLTYTSERTVLGSNSIFLKKNQPEIPLLSKSYVVLKKADSHMCSNDENLFISLCKTPPLTQKKNHD